MTNDLEIYVDLWHNFYKSELLKDVHIKRVNSFYTISGTIDVVINVVSTEWSRLITQVEHDYFKGAPQNRVMEREAVIEELNAREIKSINFKATISTRISRDSYDYVMRGGSNELDGFIDKLIIDKFTTINDEEHSGDELHESSVFYGEVLLHLIDSLYKPTSVFTNSLRIIAKRRRNR